jgi:predicted lipoprotein with Yx(FWY)xxD motif
MSELGRRLVLRGAALGAVVAAAAWLVTAALATSGAATSLTVRSTEFGKAVFGPNGKVVYVFGADRGQTSRCYGVCAAAWPPVLTKGPPQAGSGVEAKLLGTTTRRNGSVQVTYNGHPLYYYSADKVGKVMCQHANMHGGVWLIMKPDGHPNMAKGAMMHG